MKRKLRAIIAAMLAVCVVGQTMSLSAICASAATLNAEENVSAVSGTTGDCQWSLNGSVLTISGNGRMADYIGDTPWGNKLTEIIIENGVTEIGINAFSLNANLKNITIPSSVKSIGAYAFQMCENLDSIDIPNGVEAIDDSAFEGCEILEYITVADSVVCLGESVFDDTLWYNNQPDGLVYVGKIVYKYKGAMPENTNIVINAGTKAIGDSAFFDCKGLTGVTIPDGVQIIGVSAFDGCKSLTEITIPDSVTLLDDYSFYGCSLLSKAVISEGIDRIGNYAFAGCKNLRDAEISETLSSIGFAAFDECGKLTIKGKAGSVAESYATANNIPFTAIGGEINNPNVGDINKDGKINILDRIFLTRNLAQWEGYDTIDIATADVNYDGKINIIDRVVLTRHIAGWDGYKTLPVVK